MKSIFTLLSFISFFSIAQAQITANILGYKSHHENLSKVNLNGQWRGSFNEITPNIFGFVDNARTTYVLELEVHGSYVKGYSYTYFNFSGKRYYTICRVTGSFDRRANNLVVTEVERIKYNTPDTINNYFQVHHLHYVMGDDNTEYLRGEWRAAPGQTGNTGNGETLLARKMVSRTPFAIKLPPKKEEQVTAKKAPAPQKKSVPSQPHLHKAEKPTTTIASGIPTDKEPVESLGLDHKVKTAPTPVFKGYENRKNSVVNTIKISEPVFQVDFYDNGEIDGDSISVFYNGKLILSHKRLSDKPITLTLSVDKNLSQNIITMYAENLGTIPPNTALMIVHDGDKRYEVRMESDMGKSGTVIFTHGDD